MKHRARALRAMLALALTPAACTSGPDVPTSPETGTPSPTSSASCASIAPTAQDPGLHNGRAIPPAFAPTSDPELLAQQQTIRRVIEAGNQVATSPYHYGGGHRPFGHGPEAGYDASGAVSWALHGGGLLSEPRSSRGLAEWGVPRDGRRHSLLTVYASPGNAYLEIGGDRPLRLFTSAAYRDPCALPGAGPRWTAVRVSTFGYMARQAPSLITTR